MRAKLKLSTGTDEVEVIDMNKKTAWVRLVGRVGTPVIKVRIERLEIIKEEAK